MFNLRQHFVSMRAQLAEIHFAMADTPGQGVFDRIRLLVNLFLHVVAVSAFVACVVLQIGFDLLTFHLRAFGIEYGHAAASHFRDIALFEEDKAG
jgi:hypothetical protein